MSAAAACDGCGWVGKPTTRAMAANRAARHDCAAQRTRDARAARVAARAAALEATPPSPCHHTRAQHVHGTRACYVLDRCRCAPCTGAARAAEAERQRRQAYGRWQPYVDAAPVREHVRALMAAGVGLKRITALSGVGGGVLVKLVYGAGGRPPSARVRPATRDAILAVPATALAAGANVDSTGTRRRLQALAVAGWSINAQATRLGVDRQVLDHALAGHAVTKRSADAVAAGYPDLLATPRPDQTPTERGATSRARRAAAAAGWLPDAAWDDIDDPTEQPDAPSEVDAATALAEDVEWLLRTGCTWDSATTRTGRTRGALERALLRAGRRDLIRALTAATRGETAA